MNKVTATKKLQKYRKLCTYREAGVEVSFVNFLAYPAFHSLAYLRVVSGGFIPREYDPLLSPPFQPVRNAFFLNKP